MRVRDLIERLQELDPTGLDMVEIVVSQDSEGNGFSVLEEATLQRWKPPEHPWLTSQDIYESNSNIYRGTKLCIVLWPRA